MMILATTVLLILQVKLQEQFLLQLPFASYLNSGSIGKNTGKLFIMMAMNA